MFENPKENIAFLFYHTRLLLSINHQNQDGDRDFDDIEMTTFNN